MKNQWIRWAGSVAFMFGLFLAISVVHAHAQDYYVKNGGNNGADGKSDANAWADFTNVNTRTFSPGDRILLAKGSTWNAMLHPLGSGTSSAVITIDAYGSGAAPVVNGNGDIAGVYLKNQQYWVVQNLEVKNYNNGNHSTRRGIYVENEDAGTLRHIYILNNNVHHVSGIDDHDLSGGIRFQVTGSALQSKFDDVLIDSNTVGPAVDYNGIWINSSYGCRVDTNCQSGTYNWYPSTNLIISNNYVTDVMGNGIVNNETDGAVIEYNTVNGFNIRSGHAAAGIWAWDSDNTLIQYNEATGGKTTQDAQGYDFDYGTNGTTMQYNYSHDNEGGFLLICNCYYPSIAKNLTFRYNISQNDQARLFQFSGGADNLQIYNNTMYVKSGLNTQPFAGSGYGNTGFAKNNIFYLESAGPWEGLSTYYNFVFDSNTIYGVHSTGEPADANKLTTDPKLVGPGLGVSRTNVDGYKLLSGSAALGSGAVISNNGGKDYWGNPVSATAAPNRGAYNGGGNVAANPGFESGSASWANWGTASVVSSGANSGTYALKVAGASGGSEQTISVAPNTTYTLSGRGKVDAGGEILYFGVKNYGGTETSATFTTTQYTQKSLTFTTGATNTTAVIYYYKGAGSSSGYGDDVSVTANGTGTPVDPDDLALGKSVTADSIFSAGYEASKAVDGDAMSRWASGDFVGDHWLSVDLGSNQTVSQVKINWEAAYSINYKVQVKADGASTWTDVATITGNSSAGLKTHNFTPATARYVRIYSTQAALTTLVSIYSLNVYGDSDKALNKSVTVDSTYGTGYEASKATDGSDSTRWASSGASGDHWLEVDLGSDQSVSQVKVNWEAAYGVNYKIQVRAAGSSTWTDAATITGNGSAGLKTYNFSATTARYVRIYVTQAVWNTLVSIWTVNVY